MKRWPVIGVTLILITAAIANAEEKLWREREPGYSQRFLQELPQVFKHFSGIYSDLNPAVVNISSIQLERGSADSPEQQKRNLGTGVIINPEGFIVTNQHIVQNNSIITVTLADRRRFKAAVIGGDPFTDLSLIRIKDKNPLPYAFLGDATRIKPGEWVVAIGNPFGFNNAISHGIVSGMGRIISPDPTRKRFDNFLQVDVAINPGNSGGPLINMAGEVIGINTAITAHGSGVAFAVPVTTVKRIIEDLIKHGYAKRGWMGFVGRPVTPLLAKQMGLIDAATLEKNIDFSGQHWGIEIIDVVPGSPAAKAGLRKGDRIVKMADLWTDDLEEMSEQIAGTRPGSTVKVEFFRKTQQQTLEVNVGDLVKDAKL